MKVTACYYQMNHQFKDSRTLGLGSFNPIASQHHPKTILPLVAEAGKRYRYANIIRLNVMIKVFLPLVILLYSAQSQAGILDDILAWFSGDDETLDASRADTESGSGAMSSAAKSAAAAATSTAIKAGMGLMPTVVQALGVTEKQARGGLGAIFMAARATLAPQDYKLISDAVPDIDSYVGAAPPTNQLVGGAMNLLGGSAKTTAAANLVTQFNDLGLGADMIAGFSQQAIDFVKEQSPEASSRLRGVVSDYL